MRLFGTACTVLVSTLAGCSVLYSPDHLPVPKIDAAPPPDMPTDADVQNPRLMEIGPRILLEGQGTGGSRPAVLAIVGGNLGPDAIVTIEPTAGADPTRKIEVDNANAVRSPSGTALAVPVTLPVDPDHGTTGAEDVLLTVTVTQMGAGGPVTLKIVDQVVLRNLPELVVPITEIADPPVLYSQVELTVPLSFTARKGAPPAVIRAVGSIALTDVKADASGDDPGPGGGVGGSAGPAGPGGGAGGGLAAVLLGSSASGGGYGTAGGPGVGLDAVDGGPASGDDLVTRYASNTSGGGGGGGAVGGGGGGTLEITAGGTLTVGKISANGANSSGNSGAGSGGAIVLRSGGVATLGGEITASGGTANNDVSNGGLGRVRYDLPAQVGTPMMKAVSRAGVSFDIAAGVNPLVTTESAPRLRVLSAAASTQFNVIVLGANGTTISSSTVTFGSAAANITPTLISGFNRVCVTPPDGNPTILESSSCIDLAYVP